MSIDNLGKFLNAAGDSTELATQLCSAINGSDDPGEFVALGREHGYEFTNEEVISHFDSISEELSDDQLEQVAGGSSKRDWSPNYKMFSGMRLDKKPKWGQRFFLNRGTVCW